MKQRWIGVALSVALLAACEGGGGSVVSPSGPHGGPAEADDPTPIPAPIELGIFADVRGWITYGNDEGIWAVNPAPGDSSSDRIQLSERPGEPLGWSADGSKLLIKGEYSDATRVPYDDLALYVLDADGTSTRLTGDQSWGTGSISPDGSKVIYAANLPGEKWRSGIYVVDADGGPHRLLLAAGERTYPDVNGEAVTYQTGLGQPMFSPDGTQSAYFDGMGDWGNSLRVMNADGSGVRVVIDCRSNPMCPDPGAFGHYNGLVWSSDGSHLAFNEAIGWIVGVDGSGLTPLAGRDAKWSPAGSRAVVASGGIWVINADGSRRQQVAPVGHDPSWSPDGSRVGYINDGSLYTADLDGTNVRTLGTVEPPRRHTSVVWNPLPPSSPGEG
jgi:Tol biopolymer transport system component